MANWEERNEPRGDGWLAARAFRGGEQVQPAASATGMKRGLKGVPLLLDERTRQAEMQRKHPLPLVVVNID